LRKPSLEVSGEVVFVVLYRCSVFSRSIYHRCARVVVLFPLSSQLPLGIVACIRGSFSPPHISFSVCLVLWIADLFPVVGVERPFPGHYIHYIADAKSYPGPLLSAPDSSRRSGSTDPPQPATSKNHSPTLCDQRPKQQSLLSRTWSFFTNLPGIYIF
jgi:hypothetical protein